MLRFWVLFVCFFLLFFSPQPQEMLCQDGAQHLTIPIQHTNSKVFTPTSPVALGVQLTLGLPVTGQDLWGGG